MRRTLSLASACLMARVSPACAMATVRVARVAASSFSADRTVAAVSSRSGTVPMMPMSGSRTSRWVLTVLGCPAGKWNGSHGYTYEERHSH